MITTIATVSSNWIIVIAVGAGFLSWALRWHKVGSANRSDSRQRASGTAYLRIMRAATTRYSLPE